MAEELEVNFDQAEELARKGSEIMVLADGTGDVDLVRELFSPSEKVDEIDFGEAKLIIMNLGDEQDVMDLAKKYENAVIVCPHGNTSLRMAKALKSLGVHAYSLKGGLAGLRAR